MSEMKTSDRAKGRWLGILPSLGVDSRYLRNKHGPCPICGDGKDRFRFDNKSGNGSWICSYCGAGDGIELVKRINGWDFRKAVSEIDKLVGVAEFKPPKSERSDQDKLRDMNAVWKVTVPITSNDAAGRYLTARTGISSFPGDLRFADSLRYYDDDAGASWHPALVAMVRDADGKPINLHRTYLSKSGMKANVAEPRRAMPGGLPKGCAIRLASHSGVLGIAEGIETALSVTALFGVPCWSVINTTLMAQWIVPRDVRELIIFGDNDANFAGQNAAFALAHRIAKAGLSVTPRFPPVVGTDWNDVHAQNNLAA